MDVSDLFDLDGKVALVTGTGGGLGSSIALHYARHGAHLILADKNTSANNALETHLQEAGYQAHAIHCDLAQKESVAELIESALQWRGRIDVLVCCAGMEGHVGPLGEVSDDDWDALMVVNLKSALWLSTGLIPQMAERSSGAVVFVSSIAGQRGNKAIGLYGISKAGLSQMARNLAVEWGPSGVSVNTIAPGLIESPLSSHLLADKNFMARRLSLTPLRRVGQAHEIAGVAVMLASSAGGFITGQTLVVDGGTVITDGN